eukprot:m.1039686 g.1039686  ORF g.1039686 m.1039686 type:complete len:991 (+) comp24149_c2_seq6:422-3394(+)
MNRTPAFASPEYYSIDAQCTVLKTGFVRKRGHIITSWRRRWCVLRTISESERTKLAIRATHILVYYKYDTDPGTGRKACGTIPILKGQTSVYPVTKGLQHRDCLKIENPGIERIYYLQPCDGTQQWLDILSSLEPPPNSDALRRSTFPNGVRLLRKEDTVEESDECDSDTIENPGCMETLDNIKDLNTASCTPEPSGPIHTNESEQNVSQVAPSGQELQTTTASENVTVKPFGVSASAVRMLLASIRSHFKDASETVNSKDAVVEVIKPMTKGAMSSYAEYLSTHASDQSRNADGEAQQTGTLVAPANVFVSHAWNASVCGLLDGLLEHSQMCAARDEPEQFYWLDICVSNQHEIDQASGDSNMGWEWWTTTFRDTIVGIGRVVVVLSPFHDPIVCSRAWCLFEAVTARTAGIPIDVVTPPSQQDALMARIQNDLDVVSNVMLNIDSHKAEATVASDLENIRRMIEDFPGKYTAVDDIYKDVLRTWLIDTAISVCDAGLLQTTQNVHIKSSVGAMLAMAGKHAKAIEYYVQIVDDVESTYGSTHVETALLYNNMGIAYGGLGKFSEAIKHFETCITVMTESGDPTDVTLPAALTNYGLLLKKLGKYQVALEKCKEALKLYTSIHGDIHLDIATALHNVGTIQLEMRDFECASISITKSIDMFSLLGKARHPLMASAYNDLAAVSLMTQDNENVVIYANKALDIWHQTDGDFNPKVTDAYGNLGGAYMNMQNFDSAIEYYRKCIDIITKCFCAEHPDLVLCYCNLANVYSLTHDQDRSKALLHKALQICEASMSGDNLHSQLSYVHHLLGRHSREQGDMSGAKTHLEQSIDILERTHGDASVLTCGALDEMAALMQCSDFSALVQLQVHLMKHNRRSGMRLQSMSIFQCMYYISAQLDRVCQATACTVILCFEGIGFGFSASRPWYPQIIPIFCKPGPMCLHILRRRNRRRGANPEENMSHFQKNVGVLKHANSRCLHQSRMCVGVRGTVF